MSRELSIPPDATGDGGPCELVRAWVAHQDLHCSLNVDAWPADQAPVAWGILLSDIARHVADAFQTNHGLSKKETIAKIKDVFGSELDDPTAETEGHFV